MRRELVRSTAFIRAAKRLLKKQPGAAADLQQTLEMLASDASNPQLKTHKLKGDLSECWACSVGYDLRIVFEFVEQEGRQTILLLTVGSHDEVY